MFFQEPVIEKQKPILNIPALAGTKDTKKVSKTSTIQAIEAKLKTMEEASSSFYLELDKKPSNLQKRKYYFNYNQCSCIFQAIEIVLHLNTYINALKSRGLFRVPPPAPPPFSFRKS